MDSKSNNTEKASSTAYIGGLYARWFVATANVRTGCRLDNEGSWAIGVFYRDSPFSLKPIEAASSSMKNVWKNQIALSPAHQFLMRAFRGNILYLFYETKNSMTMQGDIGVAQSRDKGATWQQLGIALDEEWHLSYPYVFEYNGSIYMMPEGSAKGDLRLYRATNFPRKWTLDKIIMNKPLVDSFMLPHQGNFYLFGSDHSPITANKNGRLEIWLSNSPFGPWRPHKKNPIHNGDRSTGARNGGRPFMHNGTLYRVGQDCGETYGPRIRIFRVSIFTPNKYKDV